MFNFHDLCKLAFAFLVTSAVLSFSARANAGGGVLSQETRALSHQSQAMQQPFETAENRSGGSLGQEARSRASEIFENRCSACHGPEGHGDGPAAANLKPKPADFHNLNWQKSITDERIAQAIVQGGSAVGMSNQMAPNPDLENEPAVVSALVERIRKWGK
jgi:mono/diheme cytochrome c family protein